jgi:hypothetical protein
VDPELRALIRALDDGSGARQWVTTRGSGDRYVIMLERIHATDAQIRELAAADDRAHVRGNPYGDAYTVDEHGRVIDQGR